MSFQTILLQLSTGLLKTIEVFILTLALSLPLGLLISFGRMSKKGVLRGISKLYISIMRGTPLMLQLIVIYFMPSHLLGLQITNNWRFPAVIIAFALNYAAYFAEIYRGGIESIPVGQYEASKVLGYTHPQTFIRIVFPQVVKRILPSVTNEMITLVKDTSLAMVISVVEMFTVAKQISAHQTSIMPLMIAGVFYYFFNLIVANIMEHAEKKMQYFE